MVDRKIHAMHKRYGIDWENTCKGCSHLISGEWHDKRYHKCEPEPQLEGQMDISAFLGG